jgi:hypothetical protein
MVLRQEELISRYFDHRMSGEEEQNFLIKLAASDDMRIAFRSHLELMKAVRQDKDDLRSVAQVRNRTLAALGISAAAATPFIEQELLKSAKQDASATAASAPTGAPQATPEKAGLLQRLSTVLHTRKFALGTGLALGFSGAVAIMNLAGSPAAIEPSHVAGTTQVRTTDLPSQTTPQNTVATDPTGAAHQVSQTETIPAQEGLNSIAQQSPVTHKRTSGMRGTTQTAQPANTQPTTASQPEVTTANPGKVTVSNLNIHKSH